MEWDQAVKLAMRSVHNLALETVDYVTAIVQEVINMALETVER